MKSGGIQHVNIHLNNMQQADRTRKTGLNRVTERSASSCVSVALKNIKN